jgi:thioredoxin reductase (NADPH)
MAAQFDCMIIGGGPAGLVAATYLGRFRRRVLIWDGGDSRAQWIPLSHNTPGFPDGVSGVYLLARLREQALNYGAELRSELVTSITKNDAFEATTPTSSAAAPMLIIAAGIRNVPPPLEGHESATRAGLLRYCPICDGYESRGKRLAIYGDSESALAEADFLSIYSDDITLFPANATCAETWRSKGSAYAIGDAPIAMAVENGRVVITTKAVREAFDVLYSCLGCRPVSGLAAVLGATLSRTGGVLVDAHQRTVVPGLYAIGDVVEGLDQIAVGFGHAALAAVDVHNALRA